MALPTITALNSVGGTVTLNTLATSRQNAVDSSASVLSNEDLAAINAITTKLTAGIGVTGTFFQVTQPVSAAALPLPTGAAADATVTALSAKFGALGQGLMAASAPVVIASNQSAIPISAASLPLPTGAALDTSLATLHADLIAPTPAGEFHVGNVSTPAAVIITQAPAVTVGAYATGNVVGGLLTFAGAARVAGLDGLVQQVVVFCKSAQATAFDLIMFHTSPAASTFTDKTALAVNVADFDKIIGVAHITDWTNLGGASVAQALNLAMPYKIAGGSTTAYGVLVARSAPTFASISDIEVALKVLPN